MKKNKKIIPAIVMLLTLVILIFFIFNYTQLISVTETGTANTQNSANPQVSKERNLQTESDSHIAKENRKNLTVSFIDVGQGDSILIQYDDQEMLIDCGDNSHGKKVYEYLSSHSVQSIEYLVITHTDADHIGGCDTILENFEVVNVIMDGQQRNTASFKDVINHVNNKLNIAQVGYKNALGVASWEILHANMNSDDPNQNSVVIRLDYYNTSFLFTGDCDRKCEESLLDNDIDVDILKVAHHCSKYGTNNDFLDKVTPEIAIIQVGQGNRYGHPTPECLSRLEQANARVYRNDMVGDVVLTTDGNSYGIET